MKKLLAAVITTGALVAGVLTAAVPASAAPLTRDDMLTRQDVVSVYPGLADADRRRLDHGLTAPHAVTRDGRLHCDRYRLFRGSSNRHGWFFSTTSQDSVALDQGVIRMTGTTRAEAVLSHYRSYARTCEGSHATTDGEGGRARMVVRSWSAPRLADGSVGLLVGFVQHGTTTWRRTLVVRVGRTVTAQEVEPYSGTGSADRLVAVSRLAVARLLG